MTTEAQKATEDDHEAEVYFRLKCFELAVREAELQRNCGYTGAQTIEIAQDILEWVKSK